MPARSPLTRTHLSLDPLRAALGAMAFAAVLLLTACSPAVSGGPTSASSSKAGDAHALRDGLGSAGSLASLVPRSPAGLVYDETGSRGISTETFRGLGLESWGGVLGCEDQTDPTTSDSFAAEFTDSATARHGAASVFLYRLDDSASAATWLGKCNASSTNPFVSERVGSATAFTTKASDGPIGISIIGDVLVTVSGSQYGDDHALPLFDQIVANAAGSPTAAPSSISSVTPSPELAGGLDLTDDSQWQKACLLPLTEVAQIAKDDLDLTLTTTENGGAGEGVIECEYDDPSASGSFGIQINGYDQTSDYGFLIDDHSSTWTAPSASASYTNACATARQAGSKGITCRVVAGSGIVSGYGDAVVFAPGGLFYSIGIYSVGQDEQTGIALARIAKAIAASHPKP